MSIFPHAQGVEVNGGHFIAVTNNTYQSGQTGIDIIREAAALEAIHDSSARSCPPRCHPGTREQYIEDIVGRATPSLGDTPLPIYWMKGPAGVGKSALAQTCTEKLQKRGALGASFFFSISGQRKAETFFPTIAYQLSTVHPAYRELVDSKVRNDNTLTSKAIRFQFQHLIDEPLRELEASGKGVRRAVQILIDGLDECEKTEDQCEIIRVAAAAASEGVLPLRWAFFSRPEPHIEASFSKPGANLYCYQSTLPISRDSNGEIELYLRSAFDNILKSCNPSARTPWPSPEDLKTLVDGAGGSFIYATTVVRFVGRPDSLSPQKRLLAVISVILHGRCCATAQVKANNPFAELDAFYILILQRVPKEALLSVRLLLSLLCFDAPLGAMRAANLLGMSKDELEIACHCLSSVVHFQEPGKELEVDPSVDTSCPFTRIDRNISSNIMDQIWFRCGGSVSFHHKSFRDFLCNPARSGRYSAHDSKIVEKLYFKSYSNQARRFSWHGSELVLAPNVPNSAASFSYPSTMELVNSGLKVCAFSWNDIFDPGRFPSPFEVGAFGANRDLRKWLYIQTSFAGIGWFHSSLWGCRCVTKSLRGYITYHIPVNGFHKSAINRFKWMIRGQVLAGLIRQFHPTMTSRIKSLFGGKSQDVESALYRIGYGKKSIFWYWEIDHKLLSYRSFHSTNLEDGKKRFQEEVMDPLPIAKVRTCRKEEGTGTA